MAYEKKISRQNPGLISLLLDKSISMGEYLSGTTDKKFDWVLRYLAIIFKELLARSSDVAAMYNTRAAVSRRRPWPDPPGAAASCRN